MRLKKQSQTDISQSGPITRDNYGDRAKARADGTWFVIRSPEGGSSSHWKAADHTPAQWHAWIVWFGVHHISIVFARKNGVISVACEWPEDFDSSYGPTDHQWRPARSEAVDASRVAAVERGFAALQAKMGPLPNRRGLANFQRRADELAAKEVLAARADYWKSPLPALYPSAEAAVADAEDGERCWDIDP
jgi:hypothetical protein